MFGHLGGPQGDKNTETFSMSTTCRQFCYKSNELDFHPDPSSSFSHCHNFGKVSPFS